MCFKWYTLVCSLIFSTSKCNFHLTVMLKSVSPKVVTDRISFGLTECRIHFYSFYCSNWRTFLLKLKMTDRSQNFSTSLFAGKLTEVVEEKRNVFDELCNAHFIWFHYKTPEIEWRAIVYSTSAAFITKILKSELLWQKLKVKVTGINWLLSTGLLETIKNRSQNAES